MGWDGSIGEKMDGHRGGYRPWGAARLCTQSEPSPMVMAPRGDDSIPHHDSPLCHRTADSAAPLFPIHILLEAIQPHSHLYGNSSSGMESQEGKEVLASHGIHDESPVQGHSRKTRHKWNREDNLPRTPRAALK